MVTRSTNCTDYTRRTPPSPRPTLTCIVRAWVMVGIREVHGIVLGTPDFCSVFSRVVPKSDTCGKRVWIYRDQYGVLCEECMVSI